MQDGKAYILLAVLILLLILLIQNTYVVTLRFLVWQFQVSQVALIGIVGVGGFTAGYIARVVQMAMRKRREKQNAKTS